LSVSECAESRHTEAHAARTDCDFINFDSNDATAGTLERAACSTSFRCRCRHRLLWVYDITALTQHEAQVVEQERQ